MPAKCCIDFWNKLPEDEPVFTLAARDILSVDTIQFWLSEAKRHKVNEDKIKRAEQHLEAIVNFQLTHPERTKIPD